MKRNPNIVFMISHDTGRQLGCYGRDVDTPALDALAQRGIRFDGAFCCAPQCSPSRSGIATGMYPHRNGMMGLAHIGWSMPGGIPKLPEQMSAAGYRTVLVGHQHEGIEEDKRHGYQRIVQPQKSNQGAGAVAELAVGVLEELAQSGVADPFYLAVGFEETHRPFDRDSAAKTAADRSGPPYLPDHQDVRREMGQFAHCARKLDDGVGQIVSAIDRLGLAEETLILYTTDHGIAFPRAKGTLYDPGLETALLVSWQGTIAANQVRTNLTCNIDLFPTLCDLVGVAIAPDIDGRSFAQTLFGETPAHRNHMFAELTWHDAYHPVRGVRTEEHKYIRHFARGPSVYIPLDIHTGPAGQAVREEYYATECMAEELYDLHNDPLEQHNVVNDPRYKAVLRDLRGRVSRWMEETADPLLKGDIPGHEAPGWEEERERGTMPF